MKINILSIVKIVFLAAILVIFTTNGYSRLAGNYSGTGYSDGGSGGGDGSSGGTTAVQSVSDSPIESQVIRGAYFFLQAQSEINALMSVVEISDIEGLNYDLLLSHTEKAITHIKDAFYTYQNLIQLAEQTPYNSDILSLLKSFNYDEFSQDNGLNPIIFNQVTLYLKNGDITGTYRYIQNAFFEMHTMLNQVWLEATMDMTPNLPNLWRLSAKSSETLIFGQYISRVFYRILGKN